MNRFSAWFSAAAVVAAAAGVVLLITSAADARAEIGKWLLTLTTALVVTGTLATLVKAAEERRAVRAEWATLLHDVTAAADTVRVARLLINAHQSAAAYRDQIKELSRARTVLRRVRHERAVDDHDALRTAIKEMVSYLNRLGEEYEANYLRASRLQRVDEERLKALAGRLAAAGRVDPTNSELVEPAQAWTLLRDPKSFPRLDEFLVQAKFDTSTFEDGYTEARRLLRSLSRGAVRP